MKGSSIMGHFYWFPMVTASYKTYCKWYPVNSSYRHWHCRKYKINFIRISKEFLLCINRYDHLRKEATEEQPAKVDAGAEPWRSAIEASLTAYRDQHYKQGVVTVYGKSSGGNTTIIACIESHQYQPKNFW